MDISELAHRAQAAWFRTLADAGFPQIPVGRDGFAVSTGLASNSENGAVIPPSVAGAASELDGVLGWLRERRVPASVVVTAELEPAAAGRLVERGLVPERTGHNMGRRLDDGEFPGARWPVTEVVDGRGLRESFRVYDEDGWWEDAGALDQHVTVAERVGFGPGRPVRHWAVRDEAVVVGAATSFRFEDAVLLVNCCVAEAWRRRGVGAALTRARLAAAVEDGAVQAVVFPSPDGYQLHRSLGFEVAPVQPDRCFYLP